MNNVFVASASALLLFTLLKPLPSLPQTPAAPLNSQERTPERTQERIFGSQLMTEGERKEYREQMRRAKSDERMKARAEHRGVSLPDEPHMRGRGYGGSAPAGTPGGGGVSGGSTGGKAR
jgi:hypothetical protein